MTTCRAMAFCNWTVILAAQAYILLEGPGSGGPTRQTFRQFGLATVRVALFREQRRPGRQTQRRCPTSLHCHSFFLAQARCRLETLVCINTPAVKIRCALPGNGLAIAVPACSAELAVP